MRYGVSDQDKYREGDYTPGHFDLRLGDFRAETASLPDEAIIVMSDCADPGTQTWVDAVTNQAGTTIVIIGD